MAELSIEQQRALALARARLRAQQASAPKDYRGEGGGRGTGLEAALIGARQGVTLGFGDEINAAVRAAGDYIGNPLKAGDGVPFSEAYDKRLAHERGLLEQTRAENPVATTAGEIGGAMLIPGGATQATTVAGAAARGALSAGAFGAASGFANEEGGFTERAKGARDGLMWGALFGGSAAGAITIGTKAFRNVASAAARRPTVDRLREAKNLAYRAVDESGERFSPDDLASMTTRARAAIEEGANYVEEVDAQTRAALTILDNVSKRPQGLTIGQLDGVRQNLWKRANAAPDETGVLDAINAIDELIESRAGTSELMDAARLANRQYKKSQLLEMAFKKAEDQTASTGSGGNILNKYKQAVTAIVNDPKRAKWFAPEELAVMQQVIDGSVGENVLRRVGKLSPSGNGLMLFLNLLGGAAMGTPFLAVTAAGAGAKALADNAGASRIEGLFRGVAQEPPAPPVNVPSGINALSGYFGGR